MCYSKDADAISACQITRRWRVIVPLCHLLARARANTHSHTHTHGQQAARKHGKTGKELLLFLAGDSQEKKDEKGGGGGGNKQMELRLVELEMCVRSNAASNAAGKLLFETLNYKLNPNPKPDKPDAPCLSDYICFCTSYASIVNAYSSTFVRPYANMRVHCHLSRAILHIWNLMSTH